MYTLVYLWYNGVEISKPNWVPGIMVWMSNFNRLR